MLPFIGLLFAGAAAFAFADEPPSAETLVISLENRSAEEIIPLVSPHAAEGVSLSGRDHRLILRATPESLRHLKALVAELDSPRRQLLITVRYEERPGGVARTRSLVRQSPTGLGAPGSYTSYQTRRSNIEVVGRDISSASSSRIGTRRRPTPQDTQTLRVLEGEWAHITAGESEPSFGYPVKISETDGISILYGDSFRRMTTGFLVRATVRRKQVSVAIKSLRETPSDGGGRTELMNARTRVEGRLSEWLTIGASGSRHLPTIVGTSSLTTSLRRRDGRRILLRVDQAGP